MDILIDRQEAAKFLNVSLGTFDTLIATNKLPIAKQGIGTTRTRRKFSLTELKKIKQELREKPSEVNLHLKGTDRGLNHVMGQLLTQKKQLNELQEKIDLILEHLTNKTTH
jgi:hypothetical protein